MAKKRISGGAQITKSGKHPVLLRLSPADRDLIKRAADKEGRPVTNFFVYHAKEAARRVLAE